MADVFSKAKRSQVMSCIRGKGNRATEVALAKAFRRLGITGWRRHKSLPGRPDFIFPKRRVAVFVDGCFWHVCPLHATTPKQNAAFWKQKLNTNRTRDVTVNRILRAQGWTVMRIWQHELARKCQRQLLRRLRRLMADPPQRDRHPERA